MKRHFTLFILCLLCYISGSAYLQANPPKVVIAYVTSWTEDMPDPQYITHINYAFGHVSDTFDGVRIDNENRLKEIVGLKKGNESLNILLSIGGWGSGRFSEMAADEAKRKSFAKDCQRVVSQFQLDGIDIDWEYPTSSVGGISSSPDDTENFTLLMRDIRAVIGDNKLLTIATAANGKYIDFRSVSKSLDFVNIMSYDMGSAPWHHSALYKSENVRQSADEAVQAHIAAGMSPEQLVLGIPFYGRGTKDFADFIDYKKIIKLDDNYIMQWDDQAQAPYISDSTGAFICGYENEQSIKLKCNYIKEMGLRGAMYWEYAGDDADGTLRKAVYRGVMDK